MALFSTRNGILGGGNQFYASQLYTGTGVSQYVGGLQLSPNLTIIKDLDSGASSVLQSTNGGVSVYNSTDQNIGDTATSQSITNFGSDGFTVGTNVDVNNSGSDFTSWSWRFVAEYLTVSTYSGNGSTQNIAHGGSTEPIWILIRRTDSAADWASYIRQGSANYRAFKLNSSDAEYQDGAIADSTNITVGGFGTDLTATNASGGNYRVFSFFARTGVSASGAYTGNGSTSGPTVNVGFKPKLVVIKNRDSAGDFMVYDSSRDLSKPMSWSTPTNENSYSGFSIVLTSNGFQVTNGNSPTNTSGALYIYMCFA